MDEDVAVCWRDGGGPRCSLGSSCCFRGCFDLRHVVFNLVLFNHSIDNVLCHTRGSIALFVRMKVQAFNDLEHAQGCIVDQSKYHASTKVQMQFLLPKYLRLDLLCKTSLSRGEICTAGEKKSVSDV